MSGDLFDLAERLLGEEAAKRLRRKHRGGLNNEKGGVYEVSYCIFRLGKAAEYIATTGDECEIESQALAFVDDVAVYYPQRELANYCQLKDVHQLNWGDGDSSLAEDFRRQRQLASEQGQACQLELVVPSQRLYRRLLETIPLELKECTAVTLFPSSSSPTSLLREHGDFRQALEFLCGYKNPGLDKLEALMITLAGAWGCREKRRVSVRCFLEDLQERSSCYVRVLDGDEPIRQSIREIFDSIDGFAYEVYRGYLHWSYADGLMDGCLSFSCKSNKFEEFQKLVERQRPATFDDLEGYLL